jgi:hypothetical protein
MTSPLWEVVFEVAVFVNKFGLSLRVSFGGCGLAFLEGEAVALEPIRHARKGELDAQQTFGFFDRSLGSWRIASGQNGTQPARLLLGQFALETAT